MEILIVLATGTLNIACFLIGVKAGRREEIKADLSKLNPVNIYHEHREKEEARAERDKVETILRNLDRYDGTGMGQEDVK